MLFQSLLPKQHWNVNVLENLARGNTEDSLERFDEIIAFAAAVLTSQMVGEAESGIELFGFYEEPGAIRLPLI